MNDCSDLLINLLILFNFILSKLILLISISKSLKFLSAFFCFFNLRALHVILPTGPFFKTSTVQKQLLFIFSKMVHALLKRNWRSNFSVIYIIKINLLKEVMFFYLRSSLFKS